MGADNINLKMLNLIFPFCKQAVVHIINYSLKTETFPKMWKKSVVTPLSKVADAENMSQLRPINILPTMSKILERIVNNKIEEHLKANNLLPTTESGFRKTYSTSTALINLCCDLANSIDTS